MLECASKPCRLQCIDTAASLVVAVTSARQSYEWTSPCLVEVQSYSMGQADLVVDLPFAKHGSTSLPQGQVRGAAFASVMLLHRRFWHVATSNSHTAKTHIFRKQQNTYCATLGFSHMHMALPLLPCGMASIIPRLAMHTLLVVETII